MRNKNIIKVTMEEWINKTSYYLVQQNFDIIKEFSKNHDLIILNKLLSVFIEHFIELSINNTLHDSSENFALAEEHYEHVKKNLSELKALLQIHVAEAFTKAMGDFSSQDVEYYCQIKTVSEPKSTIMN